MTACAAGTHSVGQRGPPHRHRSVRRGDRRLGRGALAEIGIAGFANMTALSTSGVSMPFDANRDGFMIGEGGAVLVLEELDRAVARGAHIYAEVAGAAQQRRRPPHHRPGPGRVGRHRLHASGPARRRHARPAT